MPVVPGASGTFRNPGVAVGSYLNPQFKTQYAAPAPAAPIRTARFATPNAFGLGQAKGLEAFSQGLANMGQALQRIQLQDEENELKSLDVELSNRIRAELYGDPESGQEGYFTTQNNDALDGYVPVRQRIAKIRDEMLQDIGSSRVKDRFTVAAGRRLNVAFTEMAQHNNSARNAVSQQVSEARINNAKNDAADNPAVLPQSLAAIGQEVVAKMNRSGVTDDTVIANEVEKEQTDAVMQSINLQLSQGNANGAAALLRDYAEIITPAARAKASVAVLENLTIEEGQRIADEAEALGLRGEAAREFVKEQASNPAIRDDAMSRVDYNARSRRLERQDTMAAISDALPGKSQAQFDEIRGLVGDDFAQGIELARERIKDPGLREEVVRLLSVEEQRDRARNSDANIANETEMLLRFAIDEAGSEDPEAVQGVLDRLNEMDPDRYPLQLETKAMGVVLERDRQRKVLRAANVDEARRSATQAIDGGQSLDQWRASNPGHSEFLAQDAEALAAMKAMDHARATGELFAKVTDGETLYSFQRMSPEEQASANLLEMRHLLNPSEFAEARRVQAAAVNHVNRSQDENLRWINTSLDRAMKRFNPDFGTSRESEAERVQNNVIYTRAMVAVEDFIASEGRNPRPTEFQEIVAQENVKLSTERTGFFSPVTQALFGDVDIDPTELQGLTLENVDTATVEFDTILPTARTAIAKMAVDRKSSLYPDGRVPADVMAAVYASIRIARAHPDNTVRRRALRRTKELLGIR